MIMKRALLLVSIIFCIHYTTFAQKVKSIVQEASVQEAIQEESYPIPGSHLLREKEQKIRDYLDAHPEYTKLQKLIVSPVEYSSGDTKDWWADYFEEQDSGEEQYLVPSTCQAVGTNCYVFVEDAMWGTDRVDQDAVNAIVEAFDNSTPADADKGIFQIDTETFGDPPDVDNDPKIIILILDIIDGYDGSGGYVAGYFYSVNEYDDKTFYTVDQQGDTTYTRSNVAEIFYMDSNPADLINDQTDVLNTTAHEFQHMIHWQHDIGEMSFVNEGLSEIASYVCGYGVRSNSKYTQNTNVNLLSWDETGDVLDDYSRAAFWTLYIYEQFPAGILKELVNNHHSLWSDFDDTFHVYDAERGFFEVFEEWLIANYANSSSGDTRYTYQYSPLSKPVPVATHIGNSGQGSGNIIPFGAEYITFTGGDDLDITFTFSLPLIVKALNIGSLKIDEIESGIPYSPTEYGTTYREITFLIYNQSAGASKNYSYVATGTAPTGPIVLAYETGEPADGAALNLNESDTVAVYFDGLPGFKLDSVRIAFQGNGRIPILINEFTNIPPNSTNTPFGNVLSPLQVVNSNVGGSPGWYTIDLTSQNIDAANDFIVGGVIGPDNSVPGISAVSEIPVGNDHTLFYSLANFQAMWVYPVGDANNEGFIWKYMIRAFLSDGSTNVAIDQSGIVAIPNEFSLAHNYPNPFNPSTTFRFSTPKDGLVKFTVHDLLGRVLYSENRNLFAGNYSFTWEGINMLNQHVVSGVYFLRMEAEGFIQTRKMLMMK